MIGAAGDDTLSLEQAAPSPPETYWEEQDPWSGGDGSDQSGFDDDTGMNAPDDPDDTW